MLRRSAHRLLQAGVHVERGKAYRAAKLKNWPEQKVPENFRFTEEQRFRVKAMPRDTGKIPLHFVLTVLYRQQPVEVDKLWQHCSEDPACVLDSKRHLRSVLKQAREEGYLSFDRDDQGVWVCVLTRDRFDEVKKLMDSKVDSSVAASSGLRGSAITETMDSLNAFREMNDEAKLEHLKMLQEQVSRTTDTLRKFQRTEVDYLPYTDLNGKVQFMWWYETRDQTLRASDSLPDGSNVPATTQ